MKLVRLFMHASKFKFYNVEIFYHIFSQNTDILVKKLKNLKQNEAALQTLKTKLNSTTSRDASTRIITCTELATITTTILSLVSQNPSSYSIFSLIQKVSVVTFSCTTAEKEALKAITAKVDDAITIVTEEVTHIQTSLICKFFVLFSTLDILLSQC